MEENKMQVTLTPEVADGTYANLAIIAHSPSEFVIDFVRTMPGMKEAKVQSRIILTPDNTKKLLHALQENVAKYERVFGEIETNHAANNIPMSFGGGQA